MKKLICICLLSALLFFCGKVYAVDSEFYESLSQEEELYLKSQLVALMRRHDEDPHKVDVDAEFENIVEQFTVEKNAVQPVSAKDLDNLEIRRFEIQRHIQAYMASPVIEWSPAGFEELTKSEKTIGVTEVSWTAITAQNSALDRVVYAAVNSGTVIPAILITGLNSDLPGHLIAQVSENVYDSPTGKIVLIPQGSRLFGLYDSKIMFGQKRALIKWERLIYPDGSTLDLEGMPGSDKSGYAGIKGEVNNHSGPMITGVTMVSLFAGLASEYGDDKTTIQLIEPRITIGTQTEVGTISEWPNRTPPTGYFVCNGEEFDPDLCPELAVILDGNVLPDYTSTAPPYKIIKAITTRHSDYSLGSSSYRNVAGDSGNAFVEEISKSLSNMSAEYLKKYMEVAPTLKISPGYRFSVICSKEIILPVYVGNGY